MSTRGPRAPRPLVIAHRGDSSGAPEQTLAAYTRAAHLGADMIEADVRRTRDGRLVMVHDADVDRTTNGRGLVSALTFDEVRRLDAGGWFSPRFAGEPVPSLEELFELADREGVGLCLEIKGDSAAEQASLACIVASEIAQRRRLELDVLASFDHEALRTAARSCTGLRVAPDRLPERGASVDPTVVEQAQAIGAPIVQHHYADLDTDTVAELHGAGIALWAWPPKTTREVERLLTLGVDAVMGGDVAAIRAAF